jgi:methanogenic corrinoid protein MtbC1
MVGLAPLFNLSAVVRATGTSADVLRAWERRYGLPRPQRTPGGHRLYSEWDIEVVRWLKARQGEGLSISRAVDLWKETIGAGADPRERYPSAGFSPGADASADAAGRLDGLRRQWLSACFGFDASRAEDALNQAFAIYPVETVVTGLLQQALGEIGEQWYFGQVTEQQEHFATGMASRRLEALIAGTPQPTRPLTVCVGCPAGELHLFPIELLGLLLQRRGLSVVYLGADLPVEHLGDAVRAARPDLVILAAQRLTAAASLRRAARVLQAEQVPVAFGGRIFARVPGLRRRIQGHYLGDSLEMSIGAIEQLLIDPSPVAEVPPSAACLSAAEGLREKLSSIELTARKKLQRTDLVPEDMRRANEFFGPGLVAALELGDPAYLEPDLDWLKGLLSGRRLEPRHLETYLAAYRRGVNSEMGPAGRPITEWIGSYLARTKAASHRERSAMA